MAGGFRSRQTISVHVTGRAFTGPDIERNTLPAPGIDFESAGRRRSRSSSPAPRPSLPDSRETAREQRSSLRERWNGLQHFHLLVANGFTVRSDRRLHRQVAQHLEEMILNHVADGAGLIVERAAALHPEVLGHRNLHALYVVAIPERLHERICKAEDDQVVHRPLAQVMVDPEDCILFEISEQALLLRCCADARS